MNILEATVEMEVKGTKHLIKLRRCRNESGIATLALLFDAHARGSVAPWDAHKTPWRYLALDGDHRTDYSRVSLALSSQFRCRVRDLGTNSDIEDVLRTFQLVAGV